jgi:hypothetical protein
MPIQHMLAFILVAIDRRTLRPFGERCIYLTHRIVAASRRRHQVPTDQCERDGMMCSHLQFRSRYIREPEAIRRHPAFIERLQRSRRSTPSGPPSSASFATRGSQAIDYESVFLEFKNQVVRSPTLQLPISRGRRSQSMSFTCVQDTISSVFDREKPSAEPWGPLLTHPPLQAPFSFPPSAFS